MKNDIIKMLQSACINELNYKKNLFINRRSNVLFRNLHQNYMVVRELRNYIGDECIIRIPELAHHHVQIQIKFTYKEI